jgi:hypothetical protein
MQPTKFEFVINLKTAKALGVKFSDNLMSLADEAAGCCSAAIRPLSKGQPDGRRTRPARQAKGDLADSAQPHR